MPKESALNRQRGGPRVFIKVPVRYYALLNKEEAKTGFNRPEAVRVSYGTSMSPKGMRLVTDEVLKPGNFLRLDIFPPSKPVSISTLAKVVWADKAQAQVRFFAMKNKTAKALENYIRQPG